MTVFEITIGKQKETIHAKHVGKGRYIVRKLKTRNFSEIESIETLFGDNGTYTYKVKTLYPTSFYQRINPDEIKVSLIKPETE